MVGEKRMNMIQREYHLRFHTPAFLGNAEQSGQWRTPPFKAQLRQWWRVAYAASKGFQLTVAQMREEEGKLFGNESNRVCWKIENFKRPVIAAINGFCLGGGCELSCACDIRYAAENAKFGQPEVGLGITPGFGGTQRLTRVVGRGQAKELIYTGGMIDAEAAKAIGLVNKVVPQEELMDTCKKVAKEIMGNAPIAVQLAKTAINRGINCDVVTGIAYEDEVFALCFSTADQKEGMDAFVNKRAKHFQGK